MNLTKFAVCFSVLLGIAAILLVVPGGAQAPTNVNPLIVNKTFDLWVSQGFASPPFTPFEDCATFTKTQMCLARCGDCGSFSEVQMGAITIWKGQVPCGGLDLRFVGTARNLPEIPVIGAAVVGELEHTNFGAEGVQDQSCLGSASPKRGNTPYAKP